MNGIELNIEKQCQDDSELDEPQLCDSEFRIQFSEAQIHIIPNVSQAPSYR